MSPAPDIFPAAEMPVRPADAATPPAPPVSGPLTGRHVVVIGAGPGGLASALLLAQQGARVSLYERDGTVGGRSRTIVAPGGYRFDTGPTFFHYPKALAEIFARCGERLEDWVRLERLDPQYRLVFEGGGSIDATADPDRMATEIARIAPQDAGGAAAFLADTRAKFAVFHDILRRPFSRWRDMLHPALARALPYLRPHLSVDQDLARYFSDSRVRLAFSFQTKYLGMSPFSCPSLFTILSFLEYEYGVFHPVGGCGAVPEAMAALARRMGVHIHLSSPVERILFDGRRACGVVVGGQRIDADAVVVNGDFARVARQLIPEGRRPRWPDRKIARARLSCSTFMLYLGIEGTMPAELGHHTILLARDYARNIAEIEAGILPLQPSIYVQHAGFTDQGMAPAGHTSLYVLVPVPNLRDGAGIDWPAEAPRYRRLVFDRLRALGLPDIELRVRYERMVTPRDWQDQYQVHEGAVFSLAHNLRQILYWRPHNRFGRGLYLVGGGTHPGSGLPVIFEGARISTGLLTRDLARLSRRAPVPPAAMTSGVAR